VKGVSKTQMLLLLLLQQAGHEKVQEQLAMAKLSVLQTLEHGGTQLQSRLAWSLKMAMASVLLLVITSFGPFLPK
jgi:hypothetical protein